MCYPCRDATPADPCFFKDQQQPYHVHCILSAVLQCAVLCLPLLHEIHKHRTLAWGLSPTVLDTKRLTQVSMLWKALLHRQVLTAMILELRAIQTTMLTEEDSQQSSFNSLEDDMWYAFPQSCSVLLQLKESQQREQALLADLEAAKKAQQEAQQQLQQAQSQVQAAREAPPMATPSPSHRSMENGTLYSRTLNAHNPLQTDNSDSLLTLHSS